MTDELKQLLQKAKEMVDAMSPEEKQKMVRAQAESWAKAEMSWPEPNFEMKMIDGVMTKVYASFEDYCNG